MVRTSPLVCGGDAKDSFVLFFSIHASLLLVSLNFCTFFIMDPVINDVFMGYMLPRKEVKKPDAFLSNHLIELEFFNSVECLQLINNNFPPIESEFEEEEE